MRDKLEKLIGVKAASKRDEDIVKNMTGLIREKDAMIDRLRAEISSLVVRECIKVIVIQAREKELKNTIGNYELIYQKGRQGVEQQQSKHQDKVTNQSKKAVTVEEDAVEYLKNLDEKRGPVQEIYVQKRVAEKPTKTHSLREEKNSGEWLYF